MIGKSCFKNSLQVWMGGQNQWRSRASSGKILISVFSYKMK